MNNHAGWDRRGYCVACGYSDSHSDCVENLAKGQRYVSDQEFSDFIANCGLNDVTIALTCGAALPIVRRWKAGTSFPHMFVRQGMINLIKEATK